MEIPKDPAILLSYINTQLRDFYPNLDDLCKSLDIDRSRLEETSGGSGYRYQPDRNRFA